MLLDRVIENLGVEVEPIATCAVAAGWRLPLPAKDLVTLHFVLTGAGRLVVPDRPPIALPLHSLALVPPRLPHHLEAGVDPRDGAAQSWRDEGLSHLRAGPEDQQALFVVCGAIGVTWAGHRGLFDRLSEPIVVAFDDQPRMRDIFETLLAEQMSKAPGRVAMMRALMQQCLVELFRRVCGQPECRLPWLNALEDDRLARALDAIHASPGHRHTLQSLADHAAMSRAAFSARFRAVFGQTPMEYVRIVRLREAARLLRRPDLSVDAAASRAGFSSRSHFSRAFRQMFGTSPGDYRAGA